MGEYKIINGEILLSSKIHWWMGRGIGMDTLYRDPNLSNFKTYKGIGENRGSKIIGKSNWVQ